VLLALTTGHKIGLLAFAGILIAFAVLSAFVLPRFRPQYPGRGLPFFVLATIGLFAAMLTDRSQADDFVQETFLRLWLARGRYEPTGKFSAYLFQIGKRLAEPSARMAWSTVEARWGSWLNSA